MAMFAEDLYDEISIKEDKKNHVATKGKWSSGIDSKNILTIILEKFSAIKPIPTFHIELKKNIPVGAGLGGGSGNAAALIKYLVKEFNPQMSHQDIINFCLEIGADVPSCYHSEKLYFNGIGEQISLIRNAPPIYAVIVFPDIFISTKDIFTRQNSQFTTKIEHIYNFDHHKDLWSFLETTKNDLFDNVKDIYPHLSQLINTIKGTNHCKIARMTGSGSACFGLFASHKDAIEGANSLQTNFTSYSTYITKLR
jgi:4-diphosphocytidyl-2-C-methyl-D-erythritol kinase